MHTITEYDLYVLLNKFSKEGVHSKVLFFSSNAYLNAYLRAVTYFFPKKKSPWCIKCLPFACLKKETHFFLSLMSTVLSSEYRVLFIMASPSRTLSTCRINQSFCDSSAGVCLAGNQITLSKWSLWCQCRHSGHYD